MRASVTCIVAAVLLTSTPAVPLNGQELQVPLEQHRLRAFLLAAYPELDGRPIEVQTSGTGSSLKVDVNEPSIIAGTARATKQRLLNARVALSAAAEVTSFQADGALVQRESNAALARTTALAVQAGENADAVIASRGLSFGPDRSADVVARLRGLNLVDRIGSIRVLTVNPRRVTDSATHAFLWVVELEGTRPGQSPLTYELLFEPFAGQLVSLRTK